MPHARKILPEGDISQDELSSDLAGIGFIITATPSKYPNIEDTIFRASVEGMKNSDYRILGLLVDWIDIHLKAVNIDRIARLLALSTEPRVVAFWVAIAQWKKSDPRLQKIRTNFKTPPTELTENSEYNFEKHGEDPRFKGTTLHVHAKVLRSRHKDIATSEMLAKMNRSYYWRTVIGPTYRADLWAELERDATLRPSELARNAYSSFTAASDVRQDWQVVNPRPSQLK